MVLEVGYPPKVVMHCTAIRALVVGASPAIIMAVIVDGYINRDPTKFIIQVYLLP
jgi:hypothetical protein